MNTRTLGPWTRHEGPDATSFVRRDADGHGVLWLTPSGWMLGTMDAFGPEIDKAVADAAARAAGYTLDDELEAREERARE